MTITTVGNLLVNESLPESLRKDLHALDGDGVKQLFRVIAEKHPERYRDVLKGLSDVGKTAAWTEGASVSLAALADSKAKEETLGPVRQQVRAIIEDDRLDPETRRTKIADLLLDTLPTLQDRIIEEARARRSPFYVQVKSGARGKKGDLNTISGAELLATDQNDRFLPVPILNSYAEGLTPAEYWASTYSQRKGDITVKLATADAGFIGKKLSNAAHRLTVTKDKPDPTRLPVGLPVRADDRDNVGAVLAVDAPGIPAGTILTPQHLEALKDQDVDEIVIHSPLTEVTEDGGISKLAVGRRYRAGLHQIGDKVGLASAQALGEKLSQGQLSAKHNQGAKRKAQRSGIPYIQRLLESPESFPEAGPLVEEDGIVTAIRPAPQGGHYFKVNDREYYGSNLVDPVVKVGDRVEAGDDLTDGVPHPEQLVRLRGLGEARRVYTGLLKEAFDQSGAGTHRRNVETVTAGLLNWLDVTNPDGIGEHVYGDTVPAGMLYARYKPRPDARRVKPDQAVGKYLEEPVLHYTPGTRVNTKVAKQLAKFGISDLDVHDQEPDFRPSMVRSVHSVYHDPDWQTRLGGFYTSSAFQQALHRGATSTVGGTSHLSNLTAPKPIGLDRAGTGAI